MLFDLIPLKKTYVKIFTSCLRIFASLLLFDFIFVVLDIINDAKSTAKQIEADALKKSDIIIKRKEEQAKQKINNAQIEALNNIKNISAELSVKSAKVYIQKELDSKIQKALYSDSKQKLKEKL